MFDNKFRAVDLFSVVKEMFCQFGDEIYTIKKANELGRNCCNENFGDNQMVQIK